MIAAAMLFAGTAANLLIHPVAVFGINLFPYAIPIIAILAFCIIAMGAALATRCFTHRLAGNRSPETAGKPPRKLLLSQTVPYGFITDHFPMLAYAHDRQSEFGGRSAVWLRPIQA